MADPGNVPGLSFASYPPELIAEASALSRRRALLNALALSAGRGSQGITVPNKFGDMYVPPNPYAAIASTVAPIAATYMADKGQTELAGKYQEGLVKALQAYRSAQDVSPRYAEDRALISGYGPVATLATRDAGDRQKLIAEIAKMPGASVASRADTMQGLTTGGRPVDFASGLKAPQFTPVTTSLNGTGVPGQTNLETQEAHYAPRPTVTNIHMGSNEFAKQQADIIGNRLKTGMEGAIQSRGDLQTLQTALSAYNQGITTGSFQGGRNAIERLLVTANIMDDKGNRIANTDTFMRTMAGRILQHTKDLRPMSDPDRKFLEDILAGKDLGPKALEQLFQIGTENAVKNIDFHNEFVNSLPEGQPGVEPTGLELLPGARQSFRVGLPMTGEPTLDNPQGVFRMRIGPHPEDFGGRPASAPR